MDKLYSIGEFAKRVNKSQSTLRRWDRSGEFKAKRHKSGHRYYDESDVRELLNITPLDKRKVIVYCRVSSFGQKDDLASQVKAMDAYCIAKGCQFTIVNQESLSPEKEMVEDNTYFLMPLVWIKAI